MASLLARQFAEGKSKNMLMNYIMLMNRKPAKTIDGVIPGLCQNLYKSTESFIEGVASLDSQFIENTCTKALTKKLLYQFGQMKKNQSEIRTKIVQQQSASENISRFDDRIPQFKGKFFTISPYVIFGQKIQQRIKSSDPWGECVPLLSTNRFIKSDVKKFSFKQIFKSQIFGFNCFYQNKNIAYQIAQKGEITPSQSHIFIVSFETDSENHEFFVSDFNFIIKESLE